MLGFILLMCGGDEKEAFWLFAALSKDSNMPNQMPKFDGL